MFFRAMTAIVMGLGGLAAIFERVKRIDFSGGETENGGGGGDEKVVQIRGKKSNSIMLTLEMTTKKVATSKNRSRYGAG